MLLPEEHPEYIFHIDVKPRLIEDLDKVDDFSTELFIHGKTKNIQKLKSFSKLTKLWIETVNQNEFDTLMSLVNPNLKMLYIHEMRVKDLTCLGSLVHVEVLSLSWNTKATSLWDISQNTSLKSLLIKDFSKIHEIKALQNCTNLEQLDLSGGQWNSLKIDSLESLRSLHNLKYLGLSNISVQDQSLEPISHLKGLGEFAVSNQFPTEQYAMLSVALPHTQCDYFQSYTYLYHPIDGKDVIVTGKRKPFLNSTRDAKKLQKYDEKFKELQNSYRKDQF
ncbi:leucine-rich repeat domain-containing protein [Paenibacillus gallinarum]|uniref:Leucine-rich repeat domain-containing protein n=1 Tax=Paenibacillus gallinarum TaxID=2762232 RepID=A0ABR8ST06_9BACL|nr:leucine-rich repeat domain-containing protein [Paenibacillus gallinarum]MBD7966597.1 leucine-rich repeat domain-containing protein [Paenibacillus gallinarum]